MTSKIFSKCINYSLQSKQLAHITQYAGVITLIPKKGKDSLLASNYRPITLLNCDYKILSKVINNYRLYSLLNKLISNKQNGFMKGRSIGDNIRLMLNVIVLADCKNIPSAIISLDFYKAFDSLSWPFIFAMLKMYRFGEVSWIKILYKHPKCRIVYKNNLVKVGAGLGLCLRFSRLPDIIELSEILRSFGNYT